MSPLNILVEIFILDRRGKRRWPYGQAQRDGEAMKQLNVWPMLIMLILIVLLVIWLRPHG
jgi:hypothetical protein